MKKKRKDRRGTTIKSERIEDLAKAIYEDRKDDDHPSRCYVNILHNGEKGTGWHLTVSPQNRTFMFRLSHTGEIPQKDEKLLQDLEKQYDVVMEQNFLTIKAKIDAH